VAVPSKGLRYRRRAAGMVVYVSVEMGLETREREMRLTPRRLATLFCLLVGVPAFVGAQTAPTRGFAVIADDEQNQPVEVRLYRKMAAVVIGIDRYASSKLDLSYATHDARGMEAVLRDVYGFDPVYTLYDEQATRNSILELLQTRLPKETTKDDAVLVFFSGHGDTVETPTGPLGYLVPHDGDFQQAHRNISMSLLRDDVSRAIPARHVCLIVDACYGGLLATTRGGIEETRRSAAYLESIAEEPARQVLAAGDESQTVLDGGPLGYGVFTGRVIEALRNATDYITANELAVDVAEKVFEDARGRGHVQTPQFGSLSGTGDFVFVPKRQSLAQLRAETARLEAELVASRRAQQEAARENDAQRQSEELRRQAETDEKLRQAKIQAKMERERQTRAEEAAEEARRAAEARREEDRERLVEQTRAEELRRRIEQKQAGSDSALASATLDEAAARVSGLLERVAEVEKQVRAEVAQEKALVRTAIVQTVAPRDQFETTAEFAERKRRLEEGNASERARYQREVAAADAGLAERLRQGTSGFQSAVNALTGRELPVSAHGATGKLGAYDADVGIFPYEVMVEGVSSPLTGTLSIPRDAARALYEADKAGAMIVTVSGRVAEDGSVHLGDPSFGAPNLAKMYPGRSWLPTTLPVLPNRPTGSPEADRLLQELGGQDVTDKRRLDVGVLLSAMGDPRPGVGVRNGLPDIGWASVSLGGSVDIEGARKSVSPFFLAKYPVTYAQYEAFVKAGGGFNNPAWWRDMPSKHCPPSRKLGSQTNRVDSAPRTGVSWYQAVAFTRWLNAQLRGQSADVSSGGARVNGSTWELRLPAEWEWQWAAQGGLENRAYPWGSWQDGQANTYHSGLKTTTVVGMYPQSAAVNGALDMSGNVWEWCLNRWESPHSIAVSTKNATRVLRGGSFSYGLGYAASSSRLDARPNGAWGFTGFRVGLFPPQ
jgi:formylglycine-generating enzyme required for sulfatase activity